MASAMGVQGVSADSTDLTRLEEVVVTATYKASLQRAMDIKRHSGGVVDAISAEDMGKFPDTNLAESLQRISGVSIDRSGGEGQYVTVRGFGPQFNTVLVNGRTLSTDNQGREFSFDTLPSELVSSVNVHKTSSAALQSGGIGATVNLKTARPLDIDGFKTAGSVKGVYGTYSEETSPQISGMVSNTFLNETLGVLLSVNHQERSGRSDEAMTRGFLVNTGIPEAELTNSAENVFVPRNYDQRVNFDERTRSGGNLVLQYSPMDELTLTADVLYSKFDIETDVTALAHWFTSSNLENVVTDDNGTVVHLEQNTGFATDFLAQTFNRKSETTALGFNADWGVTDSLTLTFDASYSESIVDDEDGDADVQSTIGYLNRIAYDHTDGADLPSIYGFQEANGSVGHYLDPANTRAHYMQRAGWDTEDRVTQFKMDGVWDEGSSSGLTKASFGLMYTAQTKTNTRYDNTYGPHCVFCGYPDSPVGDGIANQVVFDAGSDFLGGLSGSVPTQWLRHNAEEQFQKLEDASGISFDAIRQGNSYQVEENTLAAYFEFEFMGELGRMPFTAHTGLRLESTDATVDGTEAPLERLVILDQTELLAVTSVPSPISANTDYSAFLPNMDFKLNVTDDLIARLAYSKSMTRPTVDQLVPAININGTTQGGDLAASSGNPELQPFESDNLDLSLEWYYGDTSYVSVGYFKKQVSNFIVNHVQPLTFTDSAGNLVTDPSTGDITTIYPGQDASEAVDANDEVAVFGLTSPSNGEEAEVDGLEFTVQHAFGETGFGVIANATFVDSNAELDVNDITQTFALTGLSDSLNLVGFYERGPFQIRLAWNSRDKFLQSLTQEVGSEPIFVDAYDQWDISGSYDINENVSVFFEGINITDEIITKHGRYDNQMLLVTDTGARYALGVRATF